MQALLNSFAIDTHFGIRTFEVWHGDISTLAEPYDILFVSAFPDDYYPTRSSLIGALHHNLGISVAELARNKKLDLRSSMGFWVSNSVSDVYTHSPFQYLVCVERQDNDSIETIIAGLYKAVFVLEALDIKAESIVMPLLTTGDQAGRLNIIVPCLLKAARKALENAPQLKQIRFFSYTKHKAEHFSQEMNLFLGRTRIISPEGQLITALRSELKPLFTHLLAVGFSASIISELKHVTLSSDVRSYSITIAGRKLAEYIVGSILLESKFASKVKSSDLLKKIELLSQLNIAPWVRSYLHTLRVLGNEGAHVKERLAMQPQYVDSGDLVINLTCVVQLLKFWLTWKLGTQK